MGLTEDFILWRWMIANDCRGMISGFWLETASASRGDRFVALISASAPQATTVAGFH